VRLPVTQLFTGFRTRRCAIPGLQTGFRGCGSEGGWPLHDQRWYELPAADFIVWRVEEGVKAPKCQAGGLDLGNVTRAGNVGHFGVFFAGESGCDGEDGCSQPRDRAARAFSDLLSVRRVLGT
jgi:hypothetical protein